MSEKDRKSRDRSKSKKSDDHKHHRDKSKEKSTKSKDTKPKLKPEILDIKPDQQDVDIVGKILGSMGVHLEEPKAPVVKVDEVKAPSVQPVTEPPKQIIESYSGSIYMADIANFDVTGSIVSGNFDEILKSIPTQLDIVGRIEPTIVFNYFDKVKRCPGKELCVLRLMATDESKTGYSDFFKYLHSRQRYGVVKSASPKMKDFYLIPVEAGQPMPKVLLPFNGPGIIEGDDKRPDLLVGVILKISPEERVSRVGFIRAGLISGRIFFA